MALSIQIPLPANPAWKALYHHIDQVAYNRREGVVECVVGSYPSKEASDAGLPPVLTSVTRWQGDEGAAIIAALHDAAGQVAYTFLRAADDIWGQAEDV